MVDLRERVLNREMNHVRQQGNINFSYKIDDPPSKLPATLQHEDNVREASADHHHHHHHMLQTLAEKVRINLEVLTQ
jgi:hypothetical protein